MVGNCQIPWAGVSNTFMRVSMIVFTVQIGREDCMNDAAVMMAGFWMYMKHRNRKHPYGRPDAQ